MMFGKQDKKSEAAEQAREAIQAGHTAWVYMLTSVTSKGDQPVDDWTEPIEAIEAEGWRLDQFQTSVYAPAQVNAVCIFRRASA